ncbi:MAG: MFS transporter [Candidatus Poribacteria bacterium]|nr:MFS transporter [Candidatus Poribacteria bacterium]
MKNDKKSIFGWCMYDWANSAYITTVGVALLPIYFAEGIVGKDGVPLFGATVSATALWGFMLGFAALLVFLFAPVLGAIADFSSAKKKFLLGFAYFGSLFATLLFLCKPGDVWLAVVLYICTQVCFIGGNVFYDAFLPHLASEDKLDSVSAKGFAFGYVGGSLQYGIALALVVMHKTFGIEQSMAVRIAMAMTGLWWAGWTLLTVKYLKEMKTEQTLPEKYQNQPKYFAYLSLGISQTFATVKKVGHFKHLTLFVIAYMIYNDGIHTVTSMATIYGKEELGLGTPHLMVTLLLVQVVAIGGALIFSLIANRIGARRAVMISLVLWSGVVIYGYFIQTSTEFFVLGMVVGIVLGGTQALSRSFYGAMIPEQASAEFYGFYSVFSKFSAIWGPTTFSVIKQITGSARLAIISLMVFFIVGLILLAFVNEEKAKTEKLAFDLEDDN